MKVGGGGEGGGGCLVVEIQEGGGGVVMQMIESPDFRFPEVGMLVSESKKRKRLGGLLLSLFCMQL